MTAYILSEPASQIDNSFNKLKQYIEKNSIPSAWIQRIYAVIHIVVDQKTRQHVNEAEYIKKFSTKKGINFTKKNKEVLEISGKDDFESIETTLKEGGVEHIYYLENTNINIFTLKTEKLVKEILERYKQ